METCVCICVPVELLQLAERHGNTWPICRLIWSPSDWLFLLSGGGQAVLVVFLFVCILPFQGAVRAIDELGEKRRSSFSYHKAKTLCTWNRLTDREGKGKESLWTVWSTTGINQGVVVHMIFAGIYIGAEVRGMGRAVIFFNRRARTVVLFATCCSYRNDHLQKCPGEGEHLTKAYRRFNNRLVELLKKKQVLLE